MKSKHNPNQVLLLEFLDLQLDLTINLLETARIARNQSLSWGALRDARAALCAARHLSTRTHDLAARNKSAIRIGELDSAIGALTTGPVMMPSVRSRPAGAMASKLSPSTISKAQ